MRAMQARAEELARDCAIILIHPSKKRELMRYKGDEQAAEGVADGAPHRPNRGAVELKIVAMLETHIFGPMPRTFTTSSSVWNGRALTRHPGDPALL